MNLESCPCCGGRAEMWDSGNIHGTYKTWRVCCIDCGLTQGDMRYFSAREAADAWNKRYSPQSHSKAF